METFRKILIALLPLIKMLVEVFTKRDIQVTKSENKPLPEPPAPSGVKEALKVLEEAQNQKAAVMAINKNSETPAESDYYTWFKGDYGKLGKYFKMDDFTCRCNFSGCHEQKISKQIVYKLDLLREKYGKAIIVTSGYRCDKYQAYLRRTLPAGHTVAKRSTHQEGHAADITGADVEKLYELAPEFFMAIGDARKKHFLHVDIRADKVRRWLY
jgi:hypothetical protein